MITSTAFSCYFWPPFAVVMMVVTIQNVITYMEGNDLAPFVLVMSRPPPVDSLRCKLSMQEQFFFIQLT